MPPSLDELPLIAILRGIQPEEIVNVTAALIDTGIRAFEVPLNSPEPYRSLQRLCATYGTVCLCGAGTVLAPEQVERVHEAGGSLVVSPNTDPAVIRRALQLGLTMMPGFATPTEAFTALSAGARDLKLFPAATYGTKHLKALRAVLPGTTRIFAVGGISLRNMAEWRRAGVDGFGLGSELYRPGVTASEVAQRASALIAAYHAAGAAP